MNEWQLLLSRSLSLNTQKQKGKAAAEVEDIPKKWGCEASQPMLKFTTSLYPILLTTLVTDKFLTSLNLR